MVNLELLVLHLELLLSLFVVSQDVVVLPPQNQELLVQLLIGLVELLGLHVVGFQEGVQNGNVPGEHAVIL